MKGLRVSGLLSITDIPKKFPVNCEQKLHKGSSFFLVKDNSYSEHHCHISLSFQAIGRGIANFTSVAANELTKLSEA